MHLQVDILTTFKKTSLEQFITSVPGSQLTHGTNWMNFLATLLKAHPVCLVVKDALGKYLGLLPGILQNGPYGPVLNSLPFFGSNGGVISPDKDPTVYQALFSVWHDLAKQEKCISSTIITSPFFDDQEMYEQYCPHDVTDSRIGQITALIKKENLFASFTSACRRNIRKAIKSGVRVEQSYTPDAWTFLEQTHVMNMTAIGGKPKPANFFQLVPEHFVPGRDYRLYLGWLDDEPVSALLLFYYNGIVEYFVPAVLPEHRTFQPQSLVIYTAMVDAAKEGYRYWNWGGTWVSQEGVFRFKKSWAAHERCYKYYVQVFGDRVWTMPPEELLRAYPHFYVRPFEAAVPGFSEATST